MADDRSPEADEIVRIYSQPLARILRSVLLRKQGKADPALVDDLVQDTFLCLFADGSRKLREFDGSKGSLLNYLCVIALRRARDVLRKGGVGRAEGNSALLADLESEDPSSSPWRGLEADELKERIRTALDVLPDREQLALKMVYWEQVPHLAAAKVLKVEPGAFAVFLFRARERLRKVLGNGLFCF